MNRRHADCFKIHYIFWKILGIYPFEFNQCYKYYAGTFVSTFILFYDFVSTINFYFLPREIISFVEEMICYFTQVSVLSKVLTFILLPNGIKNILRTLKSDIFTPDDEESAKVLDKAKLFITRLRKIVVYVSVIANSTHVIVPFFMHLLFRVPLLLPVCNYSFLSNETIEKFIYPLYLYQAFGMHFHMLYNVNIDCFFYGLMILTIAQLKILDVKLRNVTYYYRPAAVAEQRHSEREAGLELALNKCINHYYQLTKFCNLLQDVFSATLFIQFGVASCVICVCLFRFTLPGPFDFFVFLSTYMWIMIVQILIPCWLGTQIIHASTLLPSAVYSSDWTVRSRRFKINLRLFVERANKPLSITGGKMFPLSLTTFTSIMNSAYSFFTLLRHVQSRDL